jgi:hypothetical protein
MTTSKPTKENSKLELLRLIDNAPTARLGQQQQLPDAIISIAPKSTERVVRCFWKANLYVCSS